MDHKCNSNDDGWHILLDIISEKSYSNNTFCDDSHDFRQETSTQVIKNQSIEAIEADIMDIELSGIINQEYDTRNEEN